MHLAIPSCEEVEGCFHFHQFLLLASYNYYTESNAVDRQATWRKLLHFDEHASIGRYVRVVRCPVAIY
jgi:hypothetical protein